MLKAPPKSMCVMGDSLTDNCTLGTLPHDLWPEVLGGKLRKAGLNIQVRNFGRNGSRTDGQIAIFAQMTQYDVGPDQPLFGIIWGGANDQAALAVTSITSVGTVATVTTTANHSLAVNTLIAISGANEANYNIGARVVSVPSANTFTYALLAGAASPATGVITWNIPPEGTLENLEAMINLLKFGAKGIVLNETALPVARVGDRYVVLVDGSATGGIDAPAGQGMLPKIPGAGGNAQTVWECRYAGPNTVWGRVAVAATPGDRCKRIVVGGAHYLNHPANAGDNYDVVTNKRFLEGTSNDDVQAGIKYAPYAALRAVQAAAAAAMGVVFCDNFDFVSRRIKDGFHAQGSDAEHHAANDQHFNRYGHTLIAEAFYEKIAAQGGWLQ